MLFRAFTILVLTAPVGLAQQKLPTIPQTEPTPQNAESPTNDTATKPPLTVDPVFKASVEKVLADKKEADDKKAADLITQAKQTGTVIPLAAYWDNQLFFRTPNKDWNVHIGGRLMFESVWFQQPQSLKGGATGNGGVPNAASAAAGGVGVLDDGTFFRRARFKADGTAYGNMEFNLEVNFENLNLIAFDHAWFGLKDIPILNTVRIGQHKVPFGLENWGSDYHLTMIERSSLNDAFSTLFAPGLFTMNTLFDQNVTYQAMFHRVQPLQFYNGTDFGDGNYAFSGRATWTPVYCNEGERVVHDGGTYQYRTADLGRTITTGAATGTGSTFGDTTGAVRFRARDDIRDAAGIAGTFAGNAARFVDTGYFAADSVNSFAPEFLLIEGPFSLQTEANLVSVQNARRLFTATGLPVSPAGQAVGNPFFWGTYAELSYLLTGEHRGYDRRNGSYDRVKVRNNTGWSDSGPCGWGAWQLAYRYSYLDLSDRGINGGMLSQHTAGLNWFINDNAKLQFNYANIYRDVGAPSVSGTTHAFGVLMQYYF